jgi:ribosomal protein S18 acetylase RimI-like enzyme
MTIPMVPASRYTVEQLVDIYNETRTDYLIPMPMNVSRLAEYIHDFDIDLERSLVAKSAGRTVGLGMLGLRQNRAWITRLGVLPSHRRRGIGEALLLSILNISRFIGVETVRAEVIKGNVKAESLFRKHGFEKKEEHLVLRRAPKPPGAVPQGDVTWLGRDKSLNYLQSAPRQTWVNEIESMTNAAELQGIYLTLENGSSGWLLHRKRLLTLTHIILHTERGDPRVIGRRLLQHLHCRYPRLDTYAENIGADDPHLPAFYSMGYFEAFRRIGVSRNL